MKNVNEVLTEKKSKVEVLKREIEALRITLTLLADPELSERESPTSAKPSDVDVIDVKDGTTGSVEPHSTTGYWS